MNEQNAIEEIRNIGREIRSRGWKLKVREIKKDRALAEELGIWDLIPTKYRQYADIVKAILEAAQDGGGKTTRHFERGGETGDDSVAWTDVSEPSALYLALNESNEAESSENGTTDEYPGLEITDDYISTPDPGIEARANGDKWTVSYHDDTVTVNSKTEALAEILGMLDYRTTIDDDMTQEIEDSGVLNAVMTTPEIAKEYGIEDATVRQTILRGALPARKSGNTWLVLRKDALAKWGNRLSSMVLGLTITYWLVMVVNAL